MKAPLTLIHNARSVARFAVDLKTSFLHAANCQGTASGAASANATAEALARAYSDAAAKVGLDQVCAGQCRLASW